MGQIKVLFPFKDGEEIWLGLDTPGFRRKVFRTFNKELMKSEHIVDGLKVFELGEASVVYNHPASEEVDIIIRGSGILVDGNEEVPFRAGEWMFIPTACSISTKILAVNHFG
jgi:mannose-6-phosphate isomerase-like protein (cupin superfamily)